MRRIFGIGLVVALMASSAVACLNDRELSTHEREFRSQYSRSTRPETTAVPPRVPYDLLVGGGLGFLGVGAILTLVVGFSSRK